MVSELNLAEGHEFKQSPCNLNICSPFVYLKVHNGLRLHWFICVSRCEHGSHLRDIVKDMVFILNPNPTSLSF